MLHQSLSQERMSTTPLTSCSLTTETSVFGIPIWMGRLTQYLIVATVVFQLALIILGHGHIESKHLVVEIIEATTGLLGLAIVRSILSAGGGESERIIGRRCHLDRLNMHDAIDKKNEEFGISNDVSRKTREQSRQCVLGLLQLLNGLVLVEALFIWLSSGKLPEEIIFVGADLRWSNFRAGHVILFIFWACWMMPIPSLLAIDEVVKDIRKSHADDFDWNKDENANFLARKLDDVRQLKWDLDQCWSSVYGMPFVIWLVSCIICVLFGLFEFTMTKNPFVLSDPCWGLVVVGSEGFVCGVLFLARVTTRCTSRTSKKSLMTAILRIPTRNMRPAVFAQHHALLHEVSINGMGCRLCGLVLMDWDLLTSVIELVFTKLTVLVGVFHTMLARLD